MLIDDDELMFDDELAPELNGSANGVRPWRILVVDDDVEVHKTTQFALGGFTVDGAALQLSSAYSGEQAIQCLESDPPVLPDLMLMDVVMRTDTDGIDTAQRIRSQLALLDVPVIYLRTGQPGKLLNGVALQANRHVDKILYKADLSFQSLRAHVAEGLLLSRQGRRSD